MSIVEYKERHAIASIDIPPFGRGIPIQMPTAPHSLFHLLHIGDRSNFSLPPMLTPWNAFLEDEPSLLSRRMKRLQVAYIDSYREGERQYPWKRVAECLHADQIDTHLSDILLSIYDGIGNVLKDHGQHVFTSHGGEKRRLQLWDIVHRDYEHPQVIRAFARDLLAIPQGGDEESPYEQHARSVITRLTHPYNGDIKVPLTLEAMPMIQQGIVDRIALYLENTPYAFTVTRDGEDVIFTIPQWNKFWAAPRMCVEVPVNVLQLRWDERFLVLYPESQHVGGYIIRVNAYHRPDGNQKWQTMYLQGGIVDQNGEFIHINLESYISPMATQGNGLGEVDERSGPGVSLYQNSGVVFDTKARLATVPTDLAHRFIDTLPLPLPKDINQLMGLLNRQIQYYALTIEQNDKRQLTLNARELVRNIGRLRNHQAISPEKAEQTMQTMALAFLQAPNALLEFFRASGLSVIFPRAARLDTKERMTNLDRTDMCFPTTEVDPETGWINWKLHGLGLYMAIIHASGDQYPTQMTKRSIAAEFCWYFDPRA